MESAFGIEHFEISKGLPSALRGAKGLSGASSLRSTAHLVGRQASRNVAETKAPGARAYGFTADRANNAKNSGSRAKIAYKGTLKAIPTQKRRLP